MTRQTRGSLAALVGACTIAGLLCVAKPAEAARPGAASRPGARVAKPTGAIRFGKTPGGWYFDAHTDPWDNPNWRPPYAYRPPPPPPPIYQPRWVWDPCFGRWVPWY